MLEDMKTQKKKLTIGGDGRADSPGHSAKYGTYSLLELSCNKIIDFHLVQVYKIMVTAIVIKLHDKIFPSQSNEVGGSYHMEKEGLSRAIQHLHDKGLTMTGTDRLTNG